MYNQIIIQDSREDHQSADLLMKNTRNESKKSSGKKNKK